MIEVKINGLFLTQSQASGVILKEIKGERTLPIIIGEYEAQSIALGLEKIKPPRPITHDLALSMLESLMAKIEKIEVTELKDNTYYAIIYIRQNSNLFEIDSRPSDAIAIAVRWNSPIFVSEDVIKKAVSIDIGEEAMENSADINPGINLDQANKDMTGDKKKWKEWLMKLKPEDFGKYEM